jgi:hypothetical protein
MALRVKLLGRGKSLTPYISSVQTNGRVQRAFTEQIGKPAGQCVASGVHKGMTVGAIRKVVRDCGKRYKDTSLRLG